MPERHALEYKGRNQDGSHSWRIQPYVGTPARRVSINFRTPTKAIKAARARADEEARKAAEQAVEHDQHAGTVDQLLTDWLDRIGPDRSPRTMRGYRARADTIRTHIGHLEASELKLDDVSRMYHELRKKGATNATLLEIHRKLSAAYGWAHDMDRIAAVPAFRKVKPKHRPAEVVIPPLGVVVEAVRHVRQVDADWARAVSLVALLGLRRGEVVGLRLDDFTAANTMRVRHSVVLDEVGYGFNVRDTPKSGKQRDATLNQAAIAVMVRQRDHVEGEARRLRREVPGWLFPRWESWRWSEPASPDWLSLSWYRYRKKVGAESVGLHDFRHLYVVLAMKAGVTVPDLAAHMGHTKETLLAIYAHATEGGMELGASAVAEALGFGAETVELAAPEDSQISP